MWLLTFLRLGSLFMFVLLDSYVCEEVSNSFHPNLAPRDANKLKIPKEKLVDALREVFQVPESLIQSRAARKNYRRGQTPPQYMLDLYKKITEGKEALPLKANTVRCIMPLGGKQSF